MIIKSMDQFIPNQFFGGIPVFLDKLDKNELEQKRVYDKKALGKENIDFETARDKLGFRFCRTLKDLKFVELLKELGIKERERVLDIGCFDGHILNRLQNDFKIDGYGVDLSHEAIKRACSVKKFKNNFSVASGNYLPFADGYFDGVISLDVLEHVKDKERLIMEAFRVLRPGGWFLFYAVGKNYKNTFNYFLWKFRKKGKKYGEWGTAGHDPDNFADVNDLKNTVSGLTSHKIVYFHSFFTLIFDLYFSRIFNKCVNMRLRSRKKTGKINLNFYMVIFKFFLSLFSLFDLPWTKKSLGNGFFLYGTKMAKKI